MKRSAVKKAAFPLHFAVEQIISERALALNNGHTYLSWVWPIMAAYDDVNKTKKEQSLPVVLGHRGNPLYAIIAAHWPRWGRVVTKIATKFEEIKNLALLPQTASLANQLITKQDELRQLIQDLIDEAMDFKKAIHLFAGMNLVLTPHQEITQKVTGACLHSMVHQTRIWEAFQANNWETVNAVDVAQRMKQRIIKIRSGATAIPTPSRPNTRKPGTNGSRCKFERANGGCWKYNKAGQGNGPGQCKYQHVFPPQASSQLTGNKRKPGNNYGQQQGKPSNPGPRNSGNGQ